MHGDVLEHHMLCPESQVGILERDYWADFTKIKNIKMMEAIIKPAWSSAAFKHASNSLKYTTSQGYELTEKIH